MSETKFNIRGLHKISVIFLHLKTLKTNVYFWTDLLFFDEVHEARPLDLHRLALPVVQSQDEVEEVGLPQVGGRLLLKVSPSQTHSTADTQTEGVLEAVRGCKVFMLQKLEKFKINIRRKAN